MSRYYYRDEFQVPEETTDQPEASLSVHLSRSKNLIANAKELLNENPFDDMGNERSAESGKCRSRMSLENFSKCTTDGILMIANRYHVHRK